ncbi:5'-methylthioadenosine/S-adenosylhomocysteine nucleosidase [uncultured Neptuniibacter sp.]|uniref:5'-methylthioadenosine/S-adenosylhomocysteine nucleosidase n=1 Tax=uncultured Neptuniibacter sp. TaxID=502143 RepID=UPI002617F3A8|nr:5'-methylthioadenosine/S-adenosylhomocysteine nucleosidase [uncultured Neptuniibacter sp.]
MSTEHNMADLLEQKSGDIRIGIIGAMDEEVELLKASLDNREDHVIAGYHLFTGKLHGKEIVLLKSGIGKVNAAIGTTILLQTFKPDCIINTGSAGGYDPELNVGDIVISSEVRHHDVDLTVFGYEYGQVPRQPAAYTPDETLAAVAEKCIARMDGMKTVRGLIATGDQFMNDPDRVERKRKLFPQMKAVEMEAAAIAQTCLQFGTPFIIIRALSDIAGKESGVSFDQFLITAAKHSAEMIIAMIDELASN